MPQAQHRGFAESPLKVGVADCLTRGPVAFAGRFFCALDQTAVGHERLDSRETADIANRDVALARSNCEAIPGCRVLQLRGSAMPWKGEFDLLYALAHPLEFMAPDELRYHVHRMWLAVNRGSMLLLQVPSTLEAAQVVLPVHTWECTNGTYILVDKRLIHGNIKQERCIIIDPAADRIHEYLEEQRYYTWGEITEWLSTCGVEEVESLRDLDGNTTRDGIEVKVFVGRKA